MGELGECYHKRFIAAMGAVFTLNMSGSSRSEGRESDREGRSKEEVCQLGAATHCDCN